MDISILAGSDPIALQRLLIEKQAIIDELSMSHLGILAPAAIRRALRLTVAPCDIIAIDFRKLHEWNDLLGYDVANDYYGRFVRQREGFDGRRRDVRGQWGGDECVIAADVGDGAGLIVRMVQLLEQLTSELAPAVRAEMSTRTAGLIDGFAAVFVLVPRSRWPLHDAKRAVDECGELKKGNQTGQRATSGKAGTIIGSIGPAVAVVAI